jgi:hypothetical protein
MKRSIITIFALFLAINVGFARSAQKLFSIGTSVNWNNPESWSNAEGGQTCMMIPQSDDSIFVTSDVTLNIDFTVSNGGFLSIAAGSSLSSAENKIAVTDNSSILCNGYLKISNLETSKLALIKIGTTGKVSVLNDFLNNSTLITIDGILEVEGILENSNILGTSAISGKGTITSGTYSGTGSILGITDISLIPVQSSISECTWTGSNSNDWSDPLNWSYGRLPEAEQNISILDSRSFTPAISSITNCNNLIVNPGASLVISSEGALTVTGDLTVSEGGELRIKAGESSHGSLITVGNSVGNIIFEYNVIKDRQSDVSSPITDAQSSVFLNMYLREYDEPSAGWGQYIVPTNVPMDVMQGYEVFSTYSDTREFIGQPNAGDNHIGISTSGDGWNFIGNPYPSALNWGSQMEPSNGWSRNDVYGAIYYWDNTANGNKGNYAVYCPGGNGISANGGSRVILPSQGFFVKAKNSGSIHVTDDARVHACNTGQNGNNLTETSTLRIVAKGNSMSDESVLQFNDDATSGFDSDFDALKLTGNDEAPSLFTRLDDGTQIAINSLPTSSLDNDIPVGFSCGKAGTYKLEIHGMNTMKNDLPIYLIDLRNDALINLRTDSSYVFDYSTGSDPMRFTLHFSSPTGFEDLAVQQPKIYASRGLINIELSQKYTNSTIDVYDLTGRKVIETNTVSQGINKISFDGSGYYVIKITNHINSYTTKLWIN